MREESSLQAIDYAELNRLSDELDAEKPYIELIEGLEVPKVSPKRRHSELEFELTRILKAWAAGRGSANLEWRFWIIPAGERRTSLVPDVAWVSEERFAPLKGEAKETPAFAPDLAVGVRSPGDRLRNLERKIELYLAHGSRLVLDIDPATRTIIVYDGESSRTFNEGNVFEHSAAPGLSFDVREFFESAR